MPYKRLQRPALPPYLPSNFIRTALCRTILICYEKAVRHTPNLSLQQYGVASSDIPKALTLPRVPKSQSRRGPKDRKEVDWTKKAKYEKLISAWNERDNGFVEQFADYQPFDDEEEGLDEREELSHEEEGLQVREELSLTILAGNEGSGE